MKEPTLLVAMSSAVIAQVIPLVAFGARQVTELVQGDVEADIVVTDSVAQALHMLKETEATLFFITYFGRDAESNAKALASRFSDRVTAVPMVGNGSEVELVPLLWQLIAQKAEEGQ